MLSISKAIIILSILVTTVAKTDHGVQFRTVRESLGKTSRSSHSKVSSHGKKGKTNTKSIAKNTKSNNPPSPTPDVDPVPASGRSSSPMQCGFLEFSSQEMELLHANMTLILKDKQRTQKFPTGGVIRVFFHILKNDAGQGHVTAFQITQQMKVLNDAFAAGQWSFLLADVEYIVNNVWYYGLQNRAIESEAKRALRRGTGEDLNIYSGDLPTFLGWAYLPNFYNSHFSHFDGVVVHSESFPGGVFTNYNLGDTGDTEIGMWMI